MRMGDYVVPSYRLKSVVRDLQKTFVLYNDKEISKSELANSMGYVENSGFFNQKISDMKNFGLLTGGLGKFKLTLNAMSLFKTGDVKLLKTAVLNIPFWKYLYEKYNTLPTKDQFLTELQTVAHIGDISLKVILDKFYTAYIEDITYAMSGMTISLECVLENKIPLINESINDQTQTVNQDNLSTLMKGELRVNKLSFNADGLVIDVKDKASYYLAFVYLSIKRKEMIDNGIQI